MWNKKKEEDLPQRPTALSPAPADYGREAIPTSAYPTRQPEYASASRSAGATIGKSVVITGQVQGKEDLMLDGRLEGDVNLPENRLTVGPSGHVHGSVKAREIVVFGTVQGNLEASERVEIKKNARVVGDLKAARPVIEDEAYFKGNVETIRVDTPKPKPQPQPAPAPAPAAPPAVNPQPSLLGGEQKEPGPAKPEPRRG
jgi:cytoskeletal protein CcmA (bactofilin family)